MRKIFILTVTLLSVLIMPTTALAASGDSYTIDKVNITADLRSDGSVLIAEEWTVTVAQGCDDCFIREIDIIDDNFEHISGVTDVSVSLDGNICIQEMGDTLKNGTYFFEQESDRYSVVWYIPEAGTHTFSLRYVQTGAVKLYKNRAYFYFRAVNEDSNLICRNISVSVNTPENCFSEEFEILDSGTLAGGKSDGNVTFTAANTAGLVKFGISMPADLFDSSKLTVIVDDNRAETAFAVIIIIILVIGVAYCIYFSLNHKKILLKRRLKRCKENPLSENSEKVQREVFASISPAALINSVLDGYINKSDFFTVTVLELVKRGYIKASAEGFTAQEVSDTDFCRRKLDKNEKRIVRLFSSGRWNELITSPKIFFDEVEAFYENVGYISPFADFTVKGKKLIARCFELRLSAKRFDAVTPEEISDDFFKNSTHTVGELVIALINEYDLSENENFEKPSTENFRYNMFMFRDVYDEGAKRTSELNEARKQTKKKIGDHR